MRKSNRVIHRKIIENLTKKTKKNKYIRSPIRRGNEFLTKESEIKAKNSEDFNQKIKRNFMKFNPVTNSFKRLSGKKPLTATQDNLLSSNLNITIGEEVRIQSKKRVQPHLKESNDFYLNGVKMDRKKKNGKSNKESHEIDSNNFFLIFLLKDDAGMFKLPKGRKLYHKEHISGVKETVFTYRQTKKFPGLSNRNKNSVLKIDPFKSYFELR